MADKWDERFMDLADHVASWSKDPRTKVGSVIVDHKKRVVSMGYNGFPRGVCDHEDRYHDRPTKHLLVSHAERNALDNAPLSVEGCTLYCTLEPCVDCAKGIIQKGIARVVTKAHDREDTFHWKEARMMFEEAGVSIEWLTERTYYV